MFAYDQSNEQIRKIMDFAPEVGLILGSGLGDYGSKVENPVIIPYETVPDMPRSAVPGHANRFLLGELFGKRVIIMQGRFHYYEGYTNEQLTMPVRLMKLAGVKTLIVTNAAGGVNLDYRPGDLMLIRDFINLSGMNPLIGPNDERFGTRFPDMSDVFTKSIREKVKEVLAEAGINIQEGVYTMMSGPCFETPAEIRLIRVVGGDAIGMSTVPEVIAARHCGMQVVGITCITNMAAGILDQVLTHEEVFETAEKAKYVFEQVIDLILSKVL